MGDLGKWAKGFGLVKSCSLVRSLDGGCYGGVHEEIFLFDAKEPG